MTNTSANDFVDVLAHSPLLLPSQRNELLHSLRGRFPEIRSLAKELLSRDWLTPYQVNQLLLGKGEELVLGNFVLLERLGEGGMGRVFKARHRKLGTIVALKILRSNLLTNTTAIKRFTREMQTASKLDHPHIVRAIDADHIEGSYYLAMEYIDGIDLSRLVKRDGPLKVHQALDFVRQAALGLQHASERGLVHRDIKPANLLLTKMIDLKTSGSGVLNRPYLGKWGVIKILDMGLARITPQADLEPGTALTQMGVVMGTPDFIAPEQARNSQLTDVRSDLYSLGCTLYYLLAGRVPFPKGSVTEKLLQHQLDDPTPVEEVRRKQLFARGFSPKDVKYLSPRVGQLVRKLMTKIPEGRFQTPGELVDAISELLTPGRTPSDGSSPNQTPLPANPRRRGVSQKPIAAQTVPTNEAETDTPPIIEAEVLELPPIINRPKKNQKKGGFWKRLFGLSK